MAASSDHNDSHAHEGSAHDGEPPSEHGHGMSHVLPLRVLIGTWAVLMVLTVATVLVTRIDFGGNLNLLIAMVIATIKATLVVLYFMHLRYDNMFHAVMFISALLLALLFVSFTLMDSTQYQSDVNWQKDNLSPAPY